jgi:hypothetical protein
MSWDWQGCRPCWAMLGAQSMTPLALTAGKLYEILTSDIF